MTLEIRGQGQGLVTLLCVGFYFYLLNIIQKLKPRGYSDPEVVLLTTKIEEPGGFLKKPETRSAERGGGI